MKEKIKVYLVRFLEWIRPYLFWGSVLAEPVRTYVKKCDLESYNELKEELYEGGSALFITKSNVKYEVGNNILIKEYDERLEVTTGREILAYIFCVEDENEGLKPGYCVLGIEEAY